MKKIINTTNAPAPIGPYNQAVMAGSTLYISGQIPINPVTNKLISSSISDETTQVMENLKAVLQEAGMTFENVIKSSIFLSDLNQFDEVNNVYKGYFNEATAPARECVEVSRLPKSVNIEISMIAVEL
jgi:2-iminobutanoate/2-iminopropanoate deaminase